MPKLNRIERRDIVSNILTLLDLLHESDIKRIQNLLAQDEINSARRINRMLEFSGLQADAVNEFFHYNRTHNEDLLLALEAAKAARKDAVQNADKCELIWTGPLQNRVPARSTLAVIREMIAKAKDTVTMIGYRIEEYATPILKSLYQANSEGVQIRLVIDRAENQLSLLKTIWKEHELPPVYSRKVNPKDPMAAIHAKLIVVDASDLLVTSANLTYHGLSTNIEIGVRIRGRTAANAERLVSNLISRGDLRAV